MCQPPSVITHYDGFKREIKSPVCVVASSLTGKHYIQLTCQTNPFVIGSKQTLITPASGNRVITVASSAFILLLQKYKHAC
jgi:hypothetical protein